MLISYKTPGKIVGLVLLLATLFSCNFQKLDLTGKKGEKITQKSTIFIGIDVSGSYSQTEEFKDGVRFLAYYIYGHLNGKGGLSKPTDLYVGGIGGDKINDPQSFFPIHDFQNMTPMEIENKLVQEFGHQKDRLTDFNAFFQRVREIVKQKNLVLAPIDLVLLTDGMPEVVKNKTNKKIIREVYEKVDLSPLEYLTRNISLRLLYLDPSVGYNWRAFVPNKRIRIWTVEPPVMNGWSDQLRRNGEPGLWNWIKDNVDLRIKSK